MQMIEEKWCTLGKYQQQYIYKSHKTLNLYSIFYMKLIHVYLYALWYKIIDIYFIV